MVLDRIRTAAALLLLACLALPTYTCEGQRYIGPAGAAVGDIPDHANPAEYHRERISHYPLEFATAGPIQASVIILAFSWPVPLFLYRRRRAPASIPRWIVSLTPLSAALSGLIILRLATVGRPAIGAYLALAADVVLLADGIAELWNPSAGEGPAR